MESLLTSRSPDRFQARRSLKRSDHNPIDPKYFYIMSLRMAGHPVTEISELTGLSTPRIYAVLNDERCVQIRQQILSHTQDEFENLFEKVVKAVKEGLDNGDIGTKLEASKIWLKAHGKYTREDSSINVTAEDVVIQILNMREPADEVCVDVREFKK